MAFNIIEFTEKINGLFEGKSQTELAEMLEISQTMVSALKKGKIQSPGIDTVYRIAEKFNVSVDWLLGLAKDPTTNKATKELCATLGLSGNTIEYLKNEKNESVQNTIDFLIEQHHHVKLRIKNDEFKKPFKFPKSQDIFSLLDELSCFLALCKTTEDVEIHFDEGELLFVHYTDKGLNTNTVITNSDVLRNINTGASLLAIGKAQCINRIEQILNEMSRDSFAQFCETIVEPLMSKEQEADE